MHKRIGSSLARKARLELDTSHCITISRCTYDFRIYWLVAYITVNFKPPFKKLRALIIIILPRL